MSTASKAAGRMARREWAFLPDSHVLLWLNSDPSRIAAAQLPLHHRDPFDRLLVAQAMVEELVLMTADRRLSNYDVRILQV